MNLATSSLMTGVQTILNSRGERMTRPRRAVLAVLAEDPRHLSTEEIVAAVAVRDPDVHRSSVYRTLDALTGLGVVQHLHLSHGATLYHLRVEGKDHLHLQCSQCKTIYDLPPAALASLAAQASTEYDFALDVGHVALSGRCKHCR